MEPLKKFVEGHFKSDHFSRWANIFLVIAVTITLFLALNVFIQNIFGSIVKTETVKFAIAGSLAPIIMAIIMGVTSLGKDVMRSFKQAGSSSETYEVETTRQEKIDA